MIFERDPNSFLYLASPYTHPDAAVREWRYEQALEAMSKLAIAKIWTFSPIVQTHPLCLAKFFPMEFEHYAEWDKAMIRASGGLIVLQLDGWQESVGVKAEAMYAIELGKSVQYMGWLHTYGEKSNVEVV